MDYTETPAEKKLAEIWISGDTANLENINTNDIGNEFAITALSNVMMQGRHSSTKRVSIMRAIADKFLPQTPDKKLNGEFFMLSSNAINFCYSDQIEEGLEFFTFFVEYYNITPHTFTGRFNLMEHVLEAGSVEYYDFLLTKGFTLSCMNVTDDLIKRLINNSRDARFVYKVFDANNRLGNNLKLQIFQKACMEGRLELAQYIHEQDKIIRGKAKEIYEQRPEMYVRVIYMEWLDIARWIEQIIGKEKCCKIILSENINRCSKKTMLYISELFAAGAADY